MGIYGALSTAVTGLRAQAFSLENISGNIANSQTTGFKRIDTDFIDLIPDAPQKRQTAGSVLAQSRSTNNLQGDIKAASTDTFMAINGTGFFVVEPRAGQADGAAVFSGANYYTRRGDFELALVRLRHLGWPSPAFYAACPKRRLQHWRFATRAPN